MGMHGVEQSVLEDCLQHGKDQNASLYFILKHLDPIPKFDLLLELITLHVYSNLEKKKYFLVTLEKLKSQQYERRNYKI